MENKNGFDSLKFGSYIRSVRKEKEITLVTLGERTELSQSYLSQIESGKKGEAPSLLAVKKIARHLNIDEDTLLEMAGFFEEIVYNQEGRLEIILEMNMTTEALLNKKSFLLDNSFAKILMNVIESWVVEIGGLKADVSEEEDALIKETQELLIDAYEHDDVSKTKIGNFPSDISSTDDNALKHARYICILMYLRFILRNLHSYKVGYSFLTTLQSFFVEYIFTDLDDPFKYINLDDIDDDTQLFYNNRVLSLDENKRVIAMLKVLFP
jgi:transcriptional regulator with XRE-family HTH domain